jgi:hypothetical protein
MDNESSRQSTESGTEPEADVSDADQRRQSALQRRRMAAGRSSRDMGDGDNQQPTVGASKMSSRISARSPFVKAASSVRRSRGKSFDENDESDVFSGDENDEAADKDKDGEGKQRPPDEAEEEIVDLVGTSYPAHIYPLSLMPVSR